MLDIKDFLSEIITNSNLQFLHYFPENTNIITYTQTTTLFKIGLLNSFLIGLVLGKLWLYINNDSIGKVYINKINIYILKFINRRILNLSLFWKLFIFLFCFIVINL